MASSEGSRDETVVEAGLRYWETQPASLDSVLGGYGTGSLPRIDALGSRQFLLDLIPELRVIPSAIRPLRSADPRPLTWRFRALDVGAGIGRVTADVLLHLVSDVVLLEPVQSFIEEAHRRCRGTSSRNDESSVNGWTGIGDRTKSVCFFQGPLQDFDPACPREGTEALQRLGYLPDEDDTDSGFDVVWCQWCLGHLNDEDLVAFLKRSVVALRGPASLIVVKENLCSEDKSPRTVFDEEDSSWTRSDLAFKKIFESAGLCLVRQKIQRGLPAGLYPVKMHVTDNVPRWCFTHRMWYRYALRPNL